MILGLKGKTVVAVKRAQWPLSCVDFINLLKKKNSFALIVKKNLKLKYWDFFFHLKLVYGKHIALEI